LIYRKKASIHTLLFSKEFPSLADLSSNANSNRTFLNNSGSRLAFNERATRLQHNRACRHTSLSVEELSVNKIFQIVAVEQSLTILAIA
jgi:hypothetical protein